MQRILTAVGLALSLMPLTGLAPGPAVAQDAPEATPVAEGSPWFSAPGIAVVAGSGTGPRGMSAMAAGVQLRVPVWSVFAVTGEFTIWDLATDRPCPADPDAYVYECEYRGIHHIKLLGIEATLALGDRLELSGVAAGGHWNYPASPNARSLEGRVRLRLLDGLHVRAAGRTMRVVNPSLEAFLGEPVGYRLYTLGLEYRVRLWGSPDP